MRQQPQAVDEQRIFDALTATAFVLLEDRFHPRELFIGRQRHQGFAREERTDRRGEIIVCDHVGKADGGVFCLDALCGVFRRNLASVHSLVVADDNHVERVDEFVDAAADCRSQLTSLLDGNRVRL